jgi:hypothetical protein
MEASTKNIYLMLDSKYNPVANGLLLSPVDSPTWKVRVLDDKMNEVRRHEFLQLANMDSQNNDFVGRIVQYQRDIIILKRLRSLGSEVRQNLRMPVNFLSYIYPLTGAWKGRRSIVSYDLSCGGIAFTCVDPLEIGERLEVVIPITQPNPMVLQCEVLRQRGEDPNYLYALKFINMCSDEEKLVRHAVFRVQLDNRPAKSG